jgi:hypothetical protein
MVAGAACRWTRGGFSPIIAPQMEQASSDEERVVSYRYTFTFASGEQKSFVVRCDNRTLLLLRDDPPTPPAWTDLSFHKCANCPLNEAEHPRCPAALSLVEVVRVFGGSVPHQQVEVKIESEARAYVKKTSLQEALSSLIGLYMATSGCPVIGKLRPLVRQHLPFASVEETLYRVLSMYLLAQYMMARHGGQPDWSFAKLGKIYEGIHTVNDSFSQRLAAAGRNASLNAVATLDLFANAISCAIDEQALGDMEELFLPYLR